MPIPLFYAFALLTVIGAICLIAFRNPVASALSMVASFAGLAAIFVSLNAFFVGVIQILVYAGAIMVLFIFIIMLLDLKVEDKRSPRPLPVLAGLSLVVIFLIQLTGVLQNTPKQEMPEIQYETAALRYEKESPTIAANLRQKQLPDVHLVGHELFGKRNLELQIVGVLLLVATIGTVVLSKREKA